MSPFLPYEKQEINNYELSVYFDQGLIFFFFFFQKQSLKDSALLVFANKQDLPGAMSAAEITQKLQLTNLKEVDWHIQACCALTGQGFVHIL